MYALSGVRQVERMHEIDLHTDGRRRRKAALAGECEKLFWLARPRLLP